MRRILVTGGAGFIGSNFLHYWSQRHPEDRLVILDALTYAGNLHNLAGVKSQSAVRFVQGDIRNISLVERLLTEDRIDTIVHFAAESHVDRSILGPEAFVDTNIVGTHNLLVAARKVWLEADEPVSIHRFHNVSTDEVYGSLGPTDPPFNESGPYAPNSPYAASKAASDHLVRSYHHTYGLKVTTSNCSNNYGPYQFPEKFIPLLIVNMLQGKSLPIYGDGLNVRDWLHVSDHCRGIELVLDRGVPGETYAFGGICERSNMDIVQTLCRLMDQAFAANAKLAQRFPEAQPARGYPCETRITFVKDRLGHDRRYAIDITKSRRDLGYEPHETLETGLRRTLEWYLENEAWWRNVMDGSYRDWTEVQYKGLSSSNDYR